MNVNPFETHDRLQYFTKKNFSIGECCQNLIDQRPFGDYPFYIFAHARTEDNDVSTKRLIWQPRLTKPIAQENSMLFIGYPGTCNIKKIWIIPCRETWSQFKPQLMLEDNFIYSCIQKFCTKPWEFQCPEPEDLPEYVIDGIRMQIKEERIRRNPKPKSLELPSSSSVSQDQNSSCSSSLLEVV